LARARKTRIEVPEEVVARVMLMTDRTCCVCNIPARRGQIHHIDEDPSNGAEANLAFLCFECHDQTMIKGGFGRKLNAAQVIAFRDHWYERVHQRRAKADDVGNSLAKDAPLPVPVPIPITTRGARVPDLSHEAKVLLYQASQDPHSTVARHRYFNNQMFVQAGRQKYPKPPNETDARARAIWWDAVDELAACGLIRAVGTRDEVFRLTGQGFKVAEALDPQGEGD
jgi:hypothetical protein